MTAPDLPTAIEAGIRATYGADGAADDLAAALAANPRWRSAVEAGIVAQLTTLGRADAVAAAAAVLGNGTRPEGVRLTRASDVRPEAVRWAWRDRIALGVPTLLVGVPGLGKSMLSIWLAARVSRGDLPGDIDGPADALIASAEDSPAHTLVPRLLAAGADMNRVHFVSLVRDGFAVGITLPDDVPALTARVRDVDARLVVIDPVMAHLAGSIDSHRDHSIRRALAPLAQLAADTDCALLPIGHLNKAPSGDIFARVGGSIGLTGAARSILLMTPDPENESDDGARVLTHAKSNLGRMAPALRVRVEGRMVAGPNGIDIATARAMPGDEAPHISVADVLAPKVDDEARSERDRAAEWLRAELADRARPTREIREAAKEEGIAWRTVERARKRAGVRRVEDRDEKGKLRGWLMSLSATPPRPVGGLDSGGLDDGDLTDSKATSYDPATPATPPHSGDWRSGPSCPDCGTATELGDRCAKCHYGTGRTA